MNIRIKALGEKVRSGSIWKMCNLHEKDIVTQNQIKDRSVIVIQNKLPGPKQKKIHTEPEKIKEV